MDSETMHKVLELWPGYKDAPVLLTTAQLAEILNIPAGTLHADRCGNKLYDIPFIPAGPRLIRYPREGVARWLLKNVTTPTLA